MSLADALACLERGDRVPALDALLAAWRAHRAPAIADAIELVSSDVSRCVPTLPQGKTLRDRQDRWLDTALPKRALDVPRLLAQLAQAGDTTGAVEERLVALERHHGDDPRVARALVAMVCGGFKVNPKPMWTVVFRLLGAIHDVRGREALVAHAAVVDAAPRSPMLLQFAKRLHKLVDTLAAAEPPPLSAEQLVALARIDAHARTNAAGTPPPPVDKLVKPAAMAPQQDEASLLAQVYAAPDDPGPRQVYGDWCAEHAGELGAAYAARGELIGLQYKANLTKPGATRVRALIKQHAADWLAGIDRVIEPRSTVFEGGFLTACATRFKTKQQRETLVKDPRWQTLREVDTDEIHLVWNARALRSLRCHARLALDLARAGRPVGVALLGLQGWAWSDARENECLAALAGADCFPALRTLEGSVGSDTVPLDPARLPPTGAFANLTAIEIVRHPRAAPVLLAAWLRRMAAQPTLRRIHFDAGSFRLAIGPGGELALDLDTYFPQTDWGYGLVAQTFAEVERSQVARVVVTNANAVARPPLAIALRDLPIVWTA